MDTQPIQTHNPGLVSRAKAILLSPSSEWNRIAAEPDDAMKVFIGYVVPLAAIGPVASFIGGQLFGYGALGFTYRPTFMSALGQAIASYIMTLLAVWVVAWVANVVSSKFGGKSNYAAAFKLVVYSATAGWVASVLGVIPSLAWIGSLLGLYGIYLLYKGATPVMAVPADKAGGFTAVTVIAAIVVMLIIGAVAALFSGADAISSGGFTGAAGDSAAVNAFGGGSVTVDGESSVVDMGELGRMEIDEESGQARVIVNGQEIVIDMPEEQQ